MATYSIEGPDGKNYSIDGPEGATREQVIEAIKAREPNLADQSVTPKVENEPDTYEGFLTEVAEGAVSGVMKIGEGIVELGLTAVDLTANTNHSREFNKSVEAWKKSVGLDPEGLAGTLTEGIVQFGIPGLGAAGAVSKISKLGKLGTKIAKSKRGKIGGLGQPVQRKLTTSQRVALNAQQMVAAGVADAVVTTDGTQTIGDFFDGGPTRTDVYNVGDTGTEDAARRLSNRMSMFVEGGILAGALPPALSAIGTGLTKVGSPLASPVAKGYIAATEKIGKKIKNIEDKVRNPNENPSSFENFIAQTTTLFKNRGFLGDPTRVTVPGVKGKKGKTERPDQFAFKSFDDEVQSFDSFGEAQNEYIKMIDDFTYGSDEYLNLSKQLKTLTDEEEIAKLTDDMEELVNLNRNAMLEDSPVYGLNNARAATPDTPASSEYEETIDLFDEFTIADPTTEAAFKLAKAKFQMAESKFDEILGINMKNKGKSNFKPEYADLSKYNKEKLFNTIGEYFRGNIKVDVAGKSKNEIKASLNELGIPLQLFKPIRDMVKIKNDLTKDVLKSKAIANLPTISQIKASIPKSYPGSQEDWLILQKRRGITPQEDIRRAIEDSIIKGDGSNKSGFLVTRYEILENSKYELTESVRNDVLSMIGYARGGKTLQTFDEKTTQDIYKHISRTLKEKRDIDGVDVRVKAAEEKGLAPDPKDLELQRKLTYKADPKDKNELGDAFFSKAPTEAQAKQYIDLAFGNMKTRTEASIRGLGNTYRAPILKIPTTLFNAKQINIPTLKAIYGEIKDGKEAFVQTVTQMAQFNAVDNFYSQMRKIADFDIAKNGKNSIFKNTNEMKPSEFNQYIQTPSAKNSYIMGKSGSKSGEISDIDISESPFGAMHGIAVPANMWKSMSNIVVKDDNTTGRVARAIYTGFLRLKGASQYAKTILSPITQIRNVTSAALFAAAQGNIGRGANVMESLRIVSNDVLGRYDFGVQGYNKRAFAGQDRGSILEYLTFLQKEGIVGSSASLREIQDNLRKGTGFGYERGRSLSKSEPNIKLDEDSPEKYNQRNSDRYGGTVDPEILKKVTEESMSGLIGKIKGGAKFFEDTYKGGDDIWKIYNYEFEVNKLKTARSRYLGRSKNSKEALERKKEFDDIFLNGRSLEQVAGDRVKNLVPNYDRSSQLVKSLRKLPLGNFISFPAEIVRTGFNTLDTAMKELSSNIPEVREIGMRRLMGSLGTMIVLPLTLRETAMSLTGTSEDEMRAIQNSSAPFQRNATLIPVGRNSKGHPEVIDFSHTNPYDMIIRPMTGLLRSLDESGRLGADGIEQARKASFEGFSEFFEPFFSESIITARVRDVLPIGFLGRGGETTSGAKVFRSGEGGDTFGDQLGKSFIHVMEGLMPGGSPFRVPTGASLDQIELGRFMRGVTKPDSMEPSTGKEYSMPGELLRAVIGVNTQAYDWDKIGGFKAQEFKQNRSTAATLFNSINRRAVVSEEQFLSAWDRANAARLKVFRKQRANMLDLQRLGATQKEVIIRMKKEGVGDNEIGAMLKNIYIPFFPSNNTFKIAADKGHTIPVEKLKEKYKSFLGTPLDPVKDVVPEKTSVLDDERLTTNVVETNTPPVVNTAPPPIQTSQVSPVARDMNTRLATLLNPNDRAIAERQQRNIG
jgi:hypothetical protein|tara:strand:- start:341 stop:5290 length:4950 start_codon:yes stop_codon:yes gene_type:complete